MVSSSQLIILSIVDTSHTPKASVSADLDDLPDGVNYIMIPEKSETLIILPFLSIYTQIGQEVLKSFLSGLSGCQMD